MEKNNDSIDQEHNYIITTQCLNESSFKIHQNYLINLWKSIL